MMKKIILFLAIIASLTSKSQLTLQIGNRAFPGISTNTYGIMNSWSGIAPFERGNRHATIYPLQSIGIIPTNSQITALKFYRDVPTGQPAGVLQGNPRFKLYVKNTSLATFATAVTWQDTANTMINVFDGDPTSIVGNATGWVTFTLPTPLVYGGGNLMILLEYWQTAAATPAVVWSYDNSSVSPQVTADYFDATQNRYNSPVTALPFPVNTAGSNIRHPSLQIVYNESPIPVKLASFDATKRNNTVQLNWVTSLETGATIFDIERSADAINWNNLATMPALNTSNGAAYQHNDNKPGDINFYRLKITEDNGKVSYSTTKKVSFTKNNIFTVTPSPAHDFIRISFAQKITSNIQLINSVGVIVKQTGLQNLQTSIIDVNNLPAGVYIVKDVISASSARVIIE
jgi:Secretion system C-terminal sorting domain